MNNEGIKNVKMKLPVLCNHSIKSGVFEDWVVSMI